MHINLSNQNSQMSQIDRQTDRHRIWHHHAMHYSA